MLPPGHIAGGYLAARLVSVWVPELNQPQYLLFTSFFAFAPDLDFFYGFAKAKKFIFVESINHHKFLSHAPLVYAAIFILWFWLFPATRLVSTAFIIGTWSHFFLDSLQGDGTRWLYPFSKQMYSFSKEADIIDFREHQFFRHWWKFTTQYLHLFVAKIEILIIILAIIIYFY